jgi:hypothetical protein
MSEGDGYSLGSNQHTYFRDGHGHGRLCRACNPGLIGEFGTKPQDPDNVACLG